MGQLHLEDKLVDFTLLFSRFFKEFFEKNRLIAFKKLIKLGYGVLSFHREVSLSKRRKRGRLLIS
jgi:hypothetical protein